MIDEVGGEVHHKQHASSTTSYSEKATVIHGSEIIKGASSDGKTITLRSDSPEQDVVNEQRLFRKTALTKKIAVNCIDSSELINAEKTHRAQQQQQHQKSSTTTTTTSSNRSSQNDTRSFLNTAGSKVTGFQDVMEKMRNADNGNILSTHF